ncbi:MAG: hypothetical protein ACREU6_00660 [Steroidobacteraceae bacterium]
MNLTSDVCSIGRDPTPDELAGITWWNGLGQADRMRWLDRAWRRNEQAAGRISYSLLDFPSAADAWEAFKASATT